MIIAHARSKAFLSNLRVEPRLLLKIKKGYLVLRSENIENVSSVESLIRCISRCIIASVKRLSPRHIVGDPTNYEISARTGTVLVPLELSVLLHVCTAWLRGVGGSRTRK